jgi:hypothetical protein
MAARERNGGTGSKPNCGRHRQPVGEDHGKRRAARLWRRKKGDNEGVALRSRAASVVTDTQGNLVSLVVHEADVQDRDRAADILASIPSLYHSIPGYATEGRGR